LACSTAPGSPAAVMYRRPPMTRKGVAIPLGGLLPQDERSRVLAAG
jgi:hypothetical protein